MNWKLDNLVSQKYVPLCIFSATPFYTLQHISVQFQREMSTEWS